MRKLILFSFLFVMGTHVRAGLLGSSSLDTKNRIVVSSETPTQLLSYKTTGDDVFIYVNDDSGCSDDALMVDFVSTNFSTSVTTGTSRIPHSILWEFGKYRGNLYGLSSAGCSLTVDIWRKK